MPFLKLAFGQIIKFETQAEEGATSVTHEMKINFIDETHPQYTLYTCFRGLQKYYFLELKSEAGEFDFSNFKAKNAVEKEKYTGSYFIINSPVANCSIQLPLHMQCYVVAQDAKKKLKIQGAYAILDLEKPSSSPVSDSSSETKSPLSVYSYHSSLINAIEEAGSASAQEWLTDRDIVLCLQPYITDYHLNHQKNLHGNTHVTRPVSLMDSSSYLYEKFHEAVNYVFCSTRKNENDIRKDYGNTISKHS